MIADYELKLRDIVKPYLMPRADLEGLVDELAKYLEEQTSESYDNGRSDGYDEGYERGYEDNEDCE